MLQTHDAAENIVHLRSRIDERSASNALIHRTRHTVEDKAAGIGMQREGTQQIELQFS